MQNEALYLSPEMTREDLAAELERYMRVIGPEDPELQGVNYEKVDWLAIADFLIEIRREHLH